MRAMAILYIGPKRNPDFTKHYYVSPILAPAHLLADFPPVLMICGEKDPFVDDTVIFGGRLREAKRARRAVLLASASTSAPSARPNSRAVPPPSGAGLRGEDARRARENALMYTEEEADWVEMRILEGWGHGFLQMSNGLMLGRAAVDVIDEMADWIGDVFAAAPKKSRPVPAAASGINVGAGVAGYEVPGAIGIQVTTPTPTANTFAHTVPPKLDDRRRHSPPRVSVPMTASPSPSDIPPPRHPRRPSSVASANRASSSSSTVHPPPSAAAAAATANGTSPTKSRLNNSDLPPMSSGTETETERDSPLTFTVARKNHNGANNNHTPQLLYRDRTPRNSFSAAGHGRPLFQQREYTDDGGAPAAGAKALPSASSPPLQSASVSASSSPPEASITVAQSKHIAGDGSDVNNETLLDAITGTSVTGAGASTRTSASSADVTPKPTMSPKPGAAALLSQSELMRRRRVDAVFGMGESEDASHMDDDGDRSTEGSSSPVLTRPGQQQRAWNVSISSVESIDRNANGV